MQLISASNKSKSNSLRTSRDHQAVNGAKKLFTAQQQVENPFLSATICNINFVNLYDDNIWPFIF